MDQLDEIRSKVDIVQLISEYVPLKKAGQNFKALCPFHAEKAPSFVVSPERQIFKCFGCSSGGDIFGFLMKMEGMEFGEALRSLAKRAGVTLRSFRPTGEEAEKEKLYQLNFIASEFYHFLLTRHSIGKKALNYLLGRGIRKDSIEKFKLGFAPPMPDALTHFLTLKKGYRMDEVRKAGLVSLNYGRARDFFRERIIFPLSDHRGNIVGFSGRTLPDQDLSIPKYINIAETPLYHKSHLLYGLDLARETIKKNNAVIVVEGEFDVISPFQLGIKNIVAIKGSALTEEQCQLLKRFTETIILALDKDIAGDTASWRGIEIADGFGFEIKVVRLPEGKDPDELAQKNPGALKKALASAMPVYDFFIDSAFSHFDPNSSFGKRKIGLSVLPILKKIENDLTRAYYIRLLSQKLDLPEEALFSQMEKGEVTRDKSFAPTGRPETTSRKKLLEEHLLVLAFQSGEEKKLLSKEVNVFFQTPSLVKIIKSLADYFKKQKKFNTDKFAKQLPAELLEIFNNFFLEDLGKESQNSSWQEKEINRTLFELKKLIIQEELKKLSQEIASSEKEGKEEILVEKEEKFRLLSQKLAKLLAEG